MSLGRLAWLAGGSGIVASIILVLRKTVNYRNKRATQNELAKEVIGTEKPLSPCAFWRRFATSPRPRYRERHERN